jgi:hypothetical protein
MRRFALTFFLILAVVVSIALIYMTTGWPIARFTGGITIPADASLRVNETKLRPTEIDELRTAFGTLKTIKRSVYSEPDFEILLFRPGEDEPGYYSIWLRDGFIYEGYYLGAWTERMIRDYSKVYRIDSRTRNLLSSIETSNEPT